MPLQLPLVINSSSSSSSYKKASDADVIENAGTWQRVHDDWDWGPLMEEIETSDDEPTDDNDP